jgi:protein arginine kinase
MAELTPVERQILVEKHLISPDLLNSPEKKAVVLSDDELISIMINEEDHLRIQCLMPGLQVLRAWDLVNGIDDSMEKQIEYAFSGTMGYLTTCPTNVGTGLRASVMVHLPGLTLVGQLKGVLTMVSKLGLAVRGLYGEGTEASGNFFQVSNQITLGHAEEDIVNNLVLVTRQILAQERAAREALLSERREQLEDKVGRAYGVLRHARLITADEAMRLLSDLRLGAYLDLIQGLPPHLVTELMLLSRPAFLLRMAGKELNPFQLNVQRSNLIRQKLAELSGGE